MEFWDDSRPEDPRHLADGVPRFLDAPAVATRPKCLDPRCGRRASPTCGGDWCAEHDDGEAR